MENFPFVERDFKTGFGSKNVCVSGTICVTGLINVHVVQSVDVV